jgi:gliding motility-associated-like protein
MLTARTRNIFCLLIFFLGSVTLVKGQAGLCPPNMNFENGDFNGWSCQAGIVLPDGSLSLAPTLPLPGRHTIISAATNGPDPYGSFPMLCPNGSQYSVMLGNNGGGHQAESVSFSYSIPASLTTFSMIFNYAVVLQDFNHALFEKPRFRARIVDLSTNAPLPCVNFDFVTSAALLGFQLSPASPPGAPVYYKDWTPISINLSAYIGRSIMLEFITNDCVYSAHFGYAYIDVNTTCNGAITGTTICQGDNSITLTAPFGFQSYQWFSDNTFSTLLGTSQTLPLNPAPTVGSIMPVIVTPFPGFGCVDTLYAAITVSPKPTSNAGADAIVCKYQSAQLGGPATPAYTYIWTSAGQVSNPVISNPMGIAIPPGPAEFIVRTTDILTGCYSDDTAYISNIVVDTAIRLAGNAEFCDLKNEAALSVNSSSTSIQWYNNNATIGGAITSVYQPTISGSYWAQVVQNGCTDTTAAIPVIVHPLPLVSFGPDTDTSCVTKNSFLFTNTSSAPDNSAMTYNWIFSDGSSQQVIDAVKTFTAVGTYDVKLIATTAFTCQDSISSVVHVLPNGIPDFTWDSICVNRPVLFTNLSNENGSPLSNYRWDFKNGDPVYTVKKPAPVIYSAPGKADVTLEITNLGCENDPRTITKQVQLNRQHIPISYRSVTVPQGSSHFVHIRDSVGNVYNWKPALQLSRYNAQYTEFFATGNDVQYLIDITDSHTCVTTDTLLMQVLKKPGYYLPTGFTPNGDGLNDVARPYLVGQKALRNFSVFSRWGQLVFYTTKEGEGWNGKYNGENLDTGVYVWMLEFYNNNNQLITEKGTITIIR